MTMKNSFKKHVTILLIISLIFGFNFLSTPLPAQACLGRTLIMGVAGDSQELLILSKTIEIFVVERTATIIRLKKFENLQAARVALKKKKIDMYIGYSGLEKASNDPKLVAQLVAREMKKKHGKKKKKDSRSFTDKVFDFIKFPVKAPGIISGWLSNVDDWVKGNIKSKLAKNKTKKTVKNKNNKKLVKVRKKGNRSGKDMEMDDPADPLVFLDDFGYESAEAKVKYENIKGVKSLNPAPVSRRTIISGYPLIPRLVKKLKGRFTNEAIKAMKFNVENGEPLKDVVRNFLKQETLI